MNTSIIKNSGNITQRTLQEQNRTPEEIQNYLEKLNHETFIKLIPLVVFLNVLIVVGNLLVFLVYLKQLKASATRVFVLAMSVCDFLTNIFTLTSLIQEIRYRYTSKDLVCKLMRFLGAFPIVMSFLILVCVALDRRRRICQVHKRQLNARQATYLLIVPFILTSCFVPTFAFLYGVKHLQTGLSDVLGVTCGYANTYFGRKIKQALSIVIGITFGVGYAILAASYVHISYIICQQKKKRFPASQVKIIDTFLLMKTHRTKLNMGGKKNLQSETVENTFVGNVRVNENPADFYGQEEIIQQVMWMIERDERTENADICSRRSNLQDTFTVHDYKLEDECSTGHNTETISRCTENFRSAGDSQMRDQLRSTPTVAIMPSCYLTAGSNVSETEVQSRSVKTVERTSVVKNFAASSADSASPGHEEGTPRAPDPRNQETKKNLHKMALLSKTTCLMLALTVTSLVCYLPFLTVMFAEPKYHLSSLQFNLHFIGRCFPFINSVINPFVYSFCNPKFRLECRRLLPKACRNLFHHM